MPIPPTTIINQRDMYWCEPDPNDTVGSEQEKDRPWVIISDSRFHRGNCVVGVPLTTNTSKAVAHLIAIPASEITMADGSPARDCVALTDQIRSLDRRRFRKKVGVLSQQGLSSILLGLDYLFGK